ncbi:hypothetical protein MDPP_00251 [Candidatus Phytoplasma pini]|uniref:Uncharacterized protein n=1 Tax=Candidatus Phytoplasma pini TaxID=267362 RepID=A0A559KJD5_9MOLU|nr:hypothetical protein MDPP_00251 [Candidatus Phytoplasma pini]
MQTNHIDQIDEAIKSRFTYNIEVKPGNKEERKQFFEFLIKKRDNPYSNEAKQYLYDVINESLEGLLPTQAFKKANRTLENLLRSTVLIFAQNRGKVEPIRDAINIEDLKEAYKMNISPDISILDKIEKKIKPKRNEPKQEANKKTLSEELKNIKYVANKKKNAVVAEDAKILNDDIKTEQYCDVLLMPLRQNRKVYQGDKIKFNTQFTKDIKEIKDQKEIQELNQAKKEIDQIFDDIDSELLRQINDIETKKQKLTSNTNSTTPKQNTPKGDK